MLRFLPLSWRIYSGGVHGARTYGAVAAPHLYNGSCEGYFYEKMPSMYNPLGLGRKAMPLACKVQNLLIADFLNYLALRHDVYLPQQAAR